MARKNRPVADREKSLRPIAPKANFSLAAVRGMYAAIGGKELDCTISGHCRTQIFDFPGIIFRPNGDESHQSIYNSPSVQAYVTSNLVDYFANATRGRHYAISPCLRHEVGETDKKIRAQQKDSIPVFLVIEEYNDLTPVRMIKGNAALRMKYSCGMVKRNLYWLAVGKIKSSLPLGLPGTERGRQFPAITSKQI